MARGVCRHSGDIKYFEEKSLFFYFILIKNYLFIYLIIYSITQ